MRGVRAAGRAPWHVSTVGALCWFLRATSAWTLPDHSAPAARRQDQFYQIARRPEQLMPDPEFVAKPLEGATLPFRIGDFGMRRWDFPASHPGRSLPARVLGKASAGADGPFSPKPSQALSGTRARPPQPASGNRAARPLDTLLGSGKPMPPVRSGREIPRHSSSGKDGGLGEGNAAAQPAFGSAALGAILSANPADALIRDDSSSGHGCLDSPKRGQRREDACRA